MPLRKSSSLTNWVKSFRSDRKKHDITRESAGSRLYTSLKTQEIRLLAFKSNSPTLSYELSVVSLDEVPAFDAISYAWSDLDYAHDVVCNGVWMKVHSNVYNLLTSLSISQPDRKIWCDSICINQDSLLEKSQQIPLMRQIYSLAETVLVWLGELVEDDEKEAFSALPSLSATISGLDLPAGAYIMQDLEHHGLPPSSSSIWPGVNKLLTRPSWWSRLWPVQEIILARRIQFFHEKLRVDWSSVVQLVLALWKYELIPWLRSTSSTGYYLADGYHSTHTIDEARGQFHESGYTGCNPLRFMQQCDVTNPSDRVFAILGIVQLYIREAIDTDVSQDVASVYMQFAKAWLSADPTLQIFMFLSPELKHEGLPSWCPDFDVRRESFSFGEGYIYVGYHAGSYERITSLEFPSVDPFVPHSNKLKLRALVGAQVQTVIHEQFIYPGSLQLAKQTLIWEAACLNLSKEVSGMTGSLVPDVHWRTLVANRHEPGPNTPGGKICPPDAVERYKSWKATLQSMVAHNQHPSLDSDAAFLSYSNSTHYACKGRLFFSTSDGKVGLGPSEIEEGDLVAVFLYAPTPFILRPVNSNPPEYKILGDAYVSGIMTGELLKMRDDGLLFEQDLVIC